jgi:hypothetical protein
MNIREYIIKTSTKNFDIRIWRQYPEVVTKESNNDLHTFVKDLWDLPDIDEVAGKILELDRVNAVEVVPNNYKFNLVSVGSVYYKDWP